MEEALQQRHDLGSGHLDCRIEMDLSIVEVVEEIVEIGDRLVVGAPRVGCNAQHRIGHCKLYRFETPALDANRKRPGQRLDQVDRERALDEYVVALTCASEIEARVVNADQLLPGSTRVLVDKLGRHPLHVTVDPATGKLRIPLPAEPKKGYYFISLFIRDRNDPSRRREASWLFIISKNISKR